MLDILPVHTINQVAKNTLEYLKDYLPIITLIIGAFIGYYIDKIKVRSTFKVTRKYFFYSLFNLNKGVKEQIKIYQKQIEKVNSEVTNIPSMPITLNFTTSLVNAVSNNDLYKMLVTKGNKKDKLYIADLRVLKVGLSKIDDILKNTEKNDSNLFKSNERSVDKYNNLQPKLREEIDILLKGTDNTYSDMRDAIERLGTKFQENRNVEEEATIFKTMNNWVLPLKTILEDNNYIEPKLTPIISEMEYTFNRLKDTRDIFIKHLQTDLKNLESINTHQEILLDKYSKYVDKDLYEVEELIKKQTDSKE